MKEIVFSESAKGSLKLAQRWNTDSVQKDGPIAFVGSKPSDDVLNRLWRGEAIGGNPRDVLGLEFCLDVGDISEPVTGPRRKKEIRRLWGAWLPDEAFYQQFESSEKDLETAKAAVENGERIRIWISDAPASACGLRHFLWEIRNCECTVSVIELPRLWDNGDGTVTGYTDWGEVQPGHFARFLSLEREIGKGERRALVSEWQDAKQENAPLRAMVNGKILGVPEDFYDHLLRRHMPGGEFSMAKLIGETLGRHPVGIGDGWYALRICAMIERGELKIVNRGDGQHPCGMMLCRA